ncbi:ATP-binding cassette sub-family A member 17-like [Leptidea sinapis]|uniref:ATP-binding cassette sub-family A member 17-like n=1 Tax=Leptidea sinapis TaxID=189913 RepID=UPI0021C3358A|nr:ATP-binding cassette sub-family A member 17-like [Leptidea sinapis]
MGAQKNISTLHSRFQRHVTILFWKSYLQRQRRWRLLLIETIFASMLFVLSVFIAKPVFMTPIQVTPEPPLTSSDILNSLNEKSILGYVPNIPPYTTIMGTVANRLNIELMNASSEEDLDNLLYNRSQGTPINNPITWVIWKTRATTMWKFSIRSTERARYVTSSDQAHSNPHLRSGFLAVQLAISEAILEYVSTTTPKFELSLVPMPVSPLMQENEVRKAISLILLCFTLALLPPVLEAEALVVSESRNRFKRALRLRNVGYSSIYLGWLLYAYLTVLPITIMASITLIQIFRWIHVFYTFVMIQTYVTVTIMLALIMSMFHSKPWVAISWMAMFTLMQTFLAELVVHHRMDLLHPVLTFFLHLLLPPLGLEHGFNEFALLQTGGKGGEETRLGQSVIFTIISWSVMTGLYFIVLMILQRTMKQRAIGGEVSWKTVIFRKIEDSNKLHVIETPTGRERDKLQPVDELVAKSISMRNVSKSIMERPVLTNVTLDMYGGDFTMLYAERIQTKMMTVVEDLLIGLTYPDKGTIYVLGEEVKPGVCFMTMQQKMGYCHRSEFLIDDLTVEEHITFFLQLSLWQENKDYITEYGHLRSLRLLAECDLEGVKWQHVRDLDDYYRAQLCWAIAILLEPRIVIIPHFTGLANYTAVIKDKLMRYRHHVTFIKISHTSTYLEYSDRVFIFDHKSLVFGGTPSYLFFKYGRDYRLRISFKGNPYTKERDDLLQRAIDVGGSVRADLGSMLILRIATSPTHVVAKLVEHLHENLQHYRIASFHISVPDAEEVCSRFVGNLATGASWCRKLASSFVYCTEVLVFL